MPTLLTLAIEASNPSAAPEGESACGVALGEADERAGNARILGVEPVQPAGRHADDLMPAIDRLTRRLSVRPADLGRVAVSIGPGGYTSLRMAVATSAMIAEATGAACIPVETERIVAAGVFFHAPFAVVLASKRDRAWVRYFGPNREPLDAGGIADAVAFSHACRHFHAEAVVSDRFLPTTFAVQAQRLRLLRLIPRFDPAACFTLALARPSVPLTRLAPRYAREPEAVSLWRAGRPAAR